VIFLNTIVQDHIDAADGIVSNSFPLLSLLSFSRKIETLALVLNLNLAFYSHFFGFHSGIAHTCKTSLINILDIQPRAYITGIGSSRVVK